MLSGDIVSPKRLLFQYTKELSNSDKLRAFTAPNMTYIITFLDNDGKSYVYTRGGINGIYCYLKMILATATLTTSGQRYHKLSLSYFIKNDTASLQPVIAALRTRYKSIYKCCGIIGHKLMSASSVFQNYSYQVLEER